MKSTIEINNEMEKATSFEELEEIMKKEGIGKIRLCDRLDDLLIKYNKKKEDICNIVAISKAQVYAVFNGTRKPSKECIFKIALGLGVSIDELNELLKLAGFKELYVKKKEDAILLYGLRNQLTIYEIDELLKHNNSQITILDKED